MRLPKLLAVSAIGLSLACFAGLASSQQIYKWKDANGVIHFAQSPPPSGVHYTKMRLDAQPDVSSNPAPVADAEAQAGETPSAAPAAAPSSATQADTPSNREKLCKQLADNITLLQGKQPVVTGGAGRKQEVMSDSAREQQLATARAQRTQYCSPGGGQG